MYDGLRIVDGKKQHFSFSEIKHLSFKEKLLITKYSLITNKVAEIPFEDRFIFLDDLALIELRLHSLTQSIIADHYGDQIFEEIKILIDKLNQKLEDYKANGISQSERDKFASIPMDKVDILDGMDEINKDHDAAIIKSYVNYYKAKEELDKEMEKIYSKKNNSNK
ncbi:MAG: hypothetical protein IKG58_03585 [Bacilli bacterium]|nr:hypothetical protein [Bacilli bacterium]MBR3049619.1 hypothetical protein [Bacilli bacterium]